MTDDARTASPSPPPNAPIPLTPGPRAARFTDLYTKTLLHTLNGVPYKSFASCFPSIAVNAPESLKSLHSGLVERLEHFAREEFEQIMRERQVVEKLNVLEKVVEEGKRRRDRGVMLGKEEGGVAPHTLPPPAIIKTHLLPLHTSQQSLLNAKLQTTASQNAQLAEEIETQRKEIQEVLRLVEGLVKDLESSGELIEGVVEGEDGLAGKAREAEGVLGGL